MALFGEIQEAAALYLYTAAGIRGGETPSNVRVYTRAAEVFTDTVHNQHVSLAHQNGGHIGKCDFQELWFTLQDLFRWDGFEHHCLVVGIFQTGYGKKDFSGSQRNLCHSWDVARNVVHTVAVHLFRSALLAEANGHHFARSAFYGTAESVVRLEATGKNHTVSLKGIFVHVYGLSQFAGPQQHGVHGGKNRAAHALFRDAVTCQHFTLTFTCCTAVAAHCGHNEGHSSLGFDP